MADSHITRLFLRLHAMQTNTLSKFMPLDLHEKDTMNAEIYQVDFSGIFDDQGI